MKYETGLAVAAVQSEVPQFPVHYPDAPLGAEISGIDLSREMDDAATPHVPHDGKRCCAARLAGRCNAGKARV